MKDNAAEASRRRDRHASYISQTGDNRHTDFGRRQPVNPTSTGQTSYDKKKTMKNNDWPLSSMIVRKWLSGN
jgi:hypothetical protein